MKLEPTPLVHNRYRTPVSTPPFQFRQSADHFIVEELDAPVETAAEDGTHIWFTLRKRGVSTPDAARAIARALQRESKDVSFAGRKDTKAVTRQRMSIEHVEPDALLALDLDGLEISEPVRHRRKLRLGLLAGNRFRLRLTELTSATRDRLAVAATALARDGVPNEYGEQRFGRDGAGWEIGRTMVLGTPLEYLRALAGTVTDKQREAALELVRRAAEGTSAEKRRATELKSKLDPDLRAVATQMARRRPDDPADLLDAIPKRTRAFHLSMLQARVFNRVLAERVAAASHHTASFGDVVVTPDGRHRVLVENDPHAADTDSSLPTGPIWSADMLRAEGRPGEIELAALQADGIEPGQLAAPAGLRPRGARRPLVVPVSNLDVGAFEGESGPGGEPDGGPGGATWVCFDLPSGAFATVVLAALEKTVTG